MNVHAHFRFPWTRKTEMNSIQLIENGQEENIFWQLQKIKQQKNKNKNKTKTKQNNTRSYNKNNECIKTIRYKYISIT